ncbi:MAG: DUF3467 domain-containing protein [Candidatus Woesearchaeota archaeon]
MAKEEQQNQINKINFNITDGDSFYSNEMSITFVPTQFSFDFKNISPRVDMRSQDGSRNFVLKHNVVLIDPFQVKQFATVLNDALVRYEKEFGPIQIPAPIKKAELKAKHASKNVVTSHDVPSYFG